MVFVAGQLLYAATLNEAVTTLTGGVLRTSTDTATSGTTEKAWATTTAIPLYANTTYHVTCEVFWNNSVNGDVFFMRLRDTNTSGTIYSGIVAQTGLGGGPYSTTHTYTFTTSSATSKTFAACLVRGSGTGTATVQLNSRVSVYREGASGILATA
jgi:hypothetical protein